MPDEMFGCEVFTDFHIFSLICVWEFVGILVGEMFEGALDLGPCL